MRRNCLLLILVVASLVIGPVNRLPETSSAPPSVPSIASPPRPVTDQALIRRTARRLPANRPQLPGPPRRRLPPAGAPTPSPGDGDAGTGLGIFTGAASALGYYGGHAAFPSLELGPVPAGTSAFLYAPTAMNANTCLEWTTTYMRYSTDNATRQQVWVWDHCVLKGVAWSTPMDTVFQTNYLRNYNGNNLYFVELLQSAKPDGVTNVTYDAMLFNFTTNAWEISFEITNNLQPDTTGGWAVHENDMQQANMCPSLPAIIADQVQVKISGSFVYATPQNSNTYAGGWCFTNTPPPSTYTLQVLVQNYQWKVTTP